MKAIGYDKYTAAAGLQLVDVDVPTPEATEVLVRVDAAALNAFDWHMYGGDPRGLRLQTGLRVKERRFVGADFVGTVEAIGGDVTSVAVGDRVLAETGGGGCAEYAVASVDAVARIADSVTSESAAASVMGALTSLQVLRDSANIQPGESVLVWGASGGVGHLGVQVARALGAARVDAVCSSKNVDMVRSLGADDVFAYDGDGVSDDRRYDVILDTVSTEPVRRMRRRLASGGRWLLVGAVGGGALMGPLTPLLARMIAAKTTGVNAQMMTARTNAADLEVIAGWLADGTLKPVIARTYPLAETAIACAELERGHVAGKLVITVR